MLSCQYQQWFCKDKVKSVREAVQWHNNCRTREKARTSKGWEKKKNIPSLKKQRWFKEIKGISKGQLLPEKGRLNRAPALSEVADIQQKGWHTENPDLILPLSLMSCQDYIGWTGSPSSREPIDEDYRCLFLRAGCGGLETSSKEVNRYMQMLATLQAYLIFQSIYIGWISDQQF